MHTEQPNTQTPKCPRRRVVKAENENENTWENMLTGFGGCVRGANTFEVFITKGVKENTSRIWIFQPAEFSIHFNIYDFIKMEEK